jgi:hypothetical protein
MANGDKEENTMPNHVTNILEFSHPSQVRINTIMREIQYDDGDYGSFDFEKVIPKPATLNITSGGSQGDAINVYMSAINPDNEDIGIDKFDKKEYQKVKALVMGSERFFKPTINDTMTYEEVVKKSEEYFNRPSSPFDEKTADGHNLLTFGKLVIDNLVMYGCKDWYDWSCKYWGTKWNSYDSCPADSDSTSISFNTAWAAPHPVIEKLAEMYPDIIITHKWADEDWGNNTGKCIYNDPEIGNMEPEYLEGKEAFMFAAEILGYDTDSYYLDNDLCLDIENEMPLSFTEEDKEAWTKAGFDFSKIPAVSKDEEDQYDISRFTFNEKKALIDELVRCNIDVQEFFYA